MKLRLSAFKRLEIGSGMSLIEVLIAIGIVAFCIIGLIGLYPVLLNTMRDSREKAAAFRIFQYVTTDLRQMPISSGATRIYKFDHDAFPVTNEDSFFTAKVVSMYDSKLSQNSPNASLLFSEITVLNARNSTNLQRPFWMVAPPPAQ